MLNLNAIHKTKMQQIPYNYAVIENLLPQESCLQLAANFPQADFHLSQGEGYSYLWSEMLANNQDINLISKLGKQWSERIAEGRLHSHLSHLSSIWQQLITELWQPAYREALTEMTGLNLKDCPMLINFRRYNSGDQHRPHTDEPNKILTHLIFFNQYWPLDWGGCLRILTDSQPESIHQDIPPLHHLSAVIVRSSQSWHTVTKITTSAASCRLALRIVFFKPSN
ncbi:MAG TPA: 2OG-Fe(II) oxygenase family protein [Nostocaceae cyanobacterium]|nr:2OG-Fe(II) oxygenase family protein [Nostocaceae cyanobacterium]